MTPYSHSCCTETLLSLSLQSGVVMDFRSVVNHIIIITIVAMDFQQKVERSTYV